MIRKLYKYSLLVIFSLLFLTGGGNQEVPVSEQELIPSSSGILVLSDISEEPTKKINSFHPLADYLAANLAEFGIGSGMVKIARGPETIAGWLMSGEADLYFDSTYPAMIVCNESGGLPILRRWKDGVSEYKTLFFALSSSGLNTLHDLNGQIISFEDTVSTAY